MSLGDPQVDRLRKLAADLDVSLKESQALLYNCDGRDVDGLVRAGNYLALAAIMYRERADNQAGRGVSSPWPAARVQAEMSAILDNSGYSRGGVVLNPSPTDIA